MSKLLALDQSSRITGWAIFENGELIQHGKFEFTDSDIDTRLLKIRNKVQDLICFNRIDEVILEDIQQQNNVANNVQTFKILAEVYGVVSELLAEMQVTHSSVLATSWKSTLGIKGKSRAEQKKNAQQYVLNNLAIKATQDECDAICIGLHALHNKTKDHSWTD